MSANYCLSFNLNDTLLKNGGGLKSQEISKISFHRILKLLITVCEFFHSRDRAAYDDNIQLKAVSHGHYLHITGIAWMKIGLM